MRILNQAIWVQHLLLILNSWWSWAKEIPFLVSVSSSVKLVIVPISKSLLNMNFNTCRVLKILPGWLWQLEHAVLHILPSTYFTDKGVFQVRKDSRPLSVNFSVSDASRRGLCHIEKHNLYTSNTKVPKWKERNGLASRRVCWLGGPM